MGCLQLRRWLSFLPAAFVVYLLLHYLVYQPDLSSPQQSPLIDEGLARPNESVVGVAGGSRSLQSGPRVLLPLTPQELSVPTPLSEEPLPAEASPGGRRPDASSGTSQLPGSASPPPPHVPLGALEEASSGPPHSPNPSTSRPAPLAPHHPPRQTPVVLPSPRPPPFLPVYGGPALYPAPPQPDPRPGTALARQALHLYHQQHHQQQQQQHQQEQQQQQHREQRAGYPGPLVASSYTHSRVVAPMGGLSPPAHDDLSPVYDPFGYPEGHDLTMGAAPPQRAGVTVNQGAAVAAPQAAITKGSSPASSSSSSLSPSSSNSSSSPPSLSAGQGGAGNGAAPPSQSQAQPPAQPQAQPHAPAQPQAPPQVPPHAPAQPVVVQGTGSAVQPKQTATKKTAVVRKTNTLASSSSLLAINFLKGKQKLGERYESGFSVPHEELCLDNGRELKILVLITSAPDHQKHRLAVRQTWGHFGVRRDVVLAFMVGRTLNSDTQANLDRENDLYGDIIQANFIDHYSNLTLKTISMFEWVKTYCSESHFVLKTDDDMFINMPLLISFVDSKSTEQRVLYGRMAKGWKPIRNKKSKYYIDAGTYSRTRYPDFLTGPAYLFTSDVVEDIYHKTLDTTFFPLEDVLVTGIVGESLRLRRVGDSRFRNEKIKLTDTCSLLKTVSIHMVKYEEQFDIYKRTLDGKAKCKAG
ncbi:myocyte-specific enhancer factor 2D-like isoform X3 [Scylla paramamosain]